MQTLIGETLRYSNVKYTPRISLVLLTVKKIEREISLVLSSLFFLSLMHNSKTVKHIQTICTPNNYYQKCSFSWFWL